MEFRTLNIVVTELVTSLNFTHILCTLHALSDTGKNIIWANGGNCRVVTVNQVSELQRTAKLFALLEGETDVKKGQPLQHKIYWDDCPELPSDLSQLIHSYKTDDHSADESIDH